MNNKNNSLEKDDEPPPLPPPRGESLTRSIMADTSPDASSGTFIFFSFLLCIKFFLYNIN